jgi:Icc-related predicted phosphoesterase
MKTTARMNPEQQPAASANVKVLTVTDLHLKRVLYGELRAAVERHHPDAVCLIGDFLDAEDLPPSNVRLTPTAAALALAALPCECVAVRGNHETWDNFPEFDAAWRTTGRKLNALHGSAVRVGQLTIIGFPCGLGDEGAYAAGRELDPYGQEEWLSELLLVTGPAGRALWLQHEPPCRGIAAHEACDSEFREAIELYQPLVTVSGHDHSTPLKTGRWRTKIGDTIAVNAGQRVEAGKASAGPLIYCTMEFEFPNGRPRLASRIQRHGG